MIGLRKLLTAASAVVLLGAAATAGAQSVVLHSSNVGIDPGSFGVSILGNIITIRETYTSSGPGVLEISQLTAGTNYTIRKIITNNSGVNWNKFANELLDPVGQTNDLLDGPQPGFIPLGFSTSNDNDGLSFAQGAGLPRTSSVFNNVFVDELLNRDHIDFFNGLLLAGAVDNFMTFGLRDNANNQPFLLFQRPNESTGVIPVPAALPLLASGLLAFGFLGRRRQHAA